ncbi:ExeA family protein [Gilvimarinus agarilyticus]|uniref:ExeA family protein n=1 Tax=Gilvimarinus agarilyticus TaxID=679259 RepID=UPI0005A1C354|nr:AAA family ATPase [Gilvimarinus agarilyticus]
MLNIKLQFLKAGVTQRYVADTCGLSRGAMAQLLNHDLWPTKPEQQARVKTRLLELCKKHEIPQSDDLWEVATEETEPLCGNTAALKAGPRSTIFRDHKSNEKLPTSQEGDLMLLRRQTLTPAARQQFELVATPFGDLRSSDEVWQSRDVRLIREHLMHTAKHGGFHALVGESGSGKSTLRMDLEDRIDKEGESIVLVQPYVIAAEEKSHGGKTTLRSTHIAEALLSAVAPHKTLPSSPQARFKALHESLIESHRSGYKHCLIIEEAHDLPINTLKHLKRILELKSGFANLVGIILIGQPELMTKLNQRSAGIREVVQRCEVTRLKPIAVSDLDKFIAHRIGCVTKRDIDQIINQEGIAALVDRLTDRDGNTHLFPLAVGNFLIAAMNLAADIGCLVITNEVIQGVGGNG